MIQGSRIIFAIALLLLCFTGSVFGQEGKIIQRTYPLPDSLKQELSTKPDEARIRKNWRRLKKGMSFSQVKTLLGKPTKIESSAYDHSITWYYGKYAVIFDSVHETVRYWEKVQ